ncbi:hypothetical protein OUZ56_021360 [Daphnia magna]|uniref:Uncharacterized protein n=1 Tax=Daphnia magna TaxID=35525 RepID=A0ABQ9ZH78_9CRUS|nr:hypothetical protein OUZ56_021360 [Daphnia magna]
MTDSTMKPSSGQIQNRITKAYYSIAKALKSGLWSMEVQKRGLCPEMDVSAAIHKDMNLMLGSAFGATSCI